MEDSNKNTIFAKRMKGRAYGEFRKMYVYKRRCKSDFGSCRNNVSKEIGYIFKNVSIYKDKKYITTLKKIIICFVNNNFINKEYDGLIGYETYTKDLKGVLFC